MATSTETQTPVEAAGRACETALVSNLSWLLAQASHALATEMTAALERLGILPRGHCVLLSALSAERTQTEISHQIGLDKTTMVTTVDELERAGLAERVPSKVDRRARVIRVTAAGRRKAAEADELVERVQADVLASLPATQRQALMKALGNLVGDRLAEPAACERAVRRRD